MSKLLLLTLNQPIFAPDGKEYRAVLVDASVTVKGLLDVAFGKLALNNENIRASLVVQNVPHCNNIYDAR